MVEQWVAIGTLSLVIIGQFAFLIWRSAQNDLKVNTMWQIFVTSGELNLKQSGHQSSPIVVHDKVRDFVDKNRSRYNIKHKIGTISWEAKCTNIMMEERHRIVQVCEEVGISVTAFIRMALEHLSK